MKFSLFYLTSFFPEFHGTTRKFYDQILAQIDWAEEAGFYATWLAEHHFFDYGGHVPSIPVLGATIAARTKNMKIASGIAMIGLQDPIRVAEQFAMLDQLSNGRVLFGIGRGFQKCEFDAFGRKMDDSRIAFEEAYDVIRRAWTEDRITIDGRFTKVKDLRVIPKPMQHPTPPIYVACTFTPQSFTWTGENALNLLVVPYASPDLEIVQNNVRSYRDAYGRSKGPATNDVACAIHMYCGESVEEAKETARDPMMRYLGQFSESTRSAESSSAYQGYDGLSEALSKFPYEGFMYPDRVMFGDPDQLVLRVKTLQSWGIDHVGLVVDFGGIEHAKVMASLERFEKYVRPKFA